MKLGINTVQAESLDGKSSSLLSSAMCTDEPYRVRKGKLSGFLMLTLEQINNENARSENTKWHDELEWKTKVKKKKPYENI